MLLRLIAALLALLGLAGIGTAVASATVWRPDDSLVVTGTAATGETLLVTDAGVLDAGADTVTVRAWAQDGSQVFAAIGRENDVVSWVGEDPYSRVAGLQDRTTLSVARGEPVVVAPSPGPTPSGSATPSTTPSASSSPSSSPGAATDGATTDESETPAPDPSTSDMWFARTQQGAEVTLSWTQSEGRFSLLVASLGTNPGPPSVELTWPQEVRTPWFVPGLTLGGVLLLVAVALVLWSVRRARETRSGGTWTEIEATTGAHDLAGVPDGLGSLHAAGPSTTVGLPGPTATPTGPLTRRQIREAEQAAAAAAAAAATRGTRRSRRGSATSPATGAVPIAAPAVPQDAPSGPHSPSALPTGLGTSISQPGAGVEGPSMPTAPPEGDGPSEPMSTSAATASSTSIPGFTAPAAAGWTPTRPRDPEPTPRPGLVASSYGPSASAVQGPPRGGVPGSAPAGHLTTGGVGMSGEGVEMSAPGTSGEPGTSGADPSARSRPWRRRRAATGDEVAVGHATDIPRGEPSTSDVAVSGASAPALPPAGQPAPGPEATWGVGASRADAWRKAWGFAPGDEAAPPGVPQREADPDDPSAPTEGGAR